MLFQFARPALLLMLCSMQASAGTVKAPPATFIVERCRQPIYISVGSVGGVNDAQAEHELMGCGVGPTVAVDDSDASAEFAEHLSVRAQGEQFVLEWRTPEVQYLISNARADGKARMLPARGAKAASAAKLRVTIRPRYAPEDLKLFVQNGSATDVALAIGRALAKPVHGLAAGGPKINLEFESVDARAALQIVASEWPDIVAYLDRAGDIQFGKPNNSKLLLNEIGIQIERPYAEQDRAKTIALFKKLDALGELQDFPLRAAYADVLNSAQQYPESRIVVEALIKKAGLLPPTRENLKVLTELMTLVDLLDFPATGRQLLLDAARRLMHALPPGLTRSDEFRVLTEIAALSALNKQPSTITLITDALAAFEKLNQSEPLSAIGAVYVLLSVAHQHCQNEMSANQPQRAQAAAKAGLAVWEAAFGAKTDVASFDQGQKEALTLQLANASAVAGDSALALKTLDAIDCATLTRSCEFALVWRAAIALYSKDYAQAQQALKRLQEFKARLPDASNSLIRTFEDQAMLHRIANQEDAAKRLSARAQLLRRPAQKPDELDISLATTLVSKLLLPLQSKTNDEPFQHYLMAEALRGSGQKAAALAEFAMAERGFRALGDTVMAKRCAEIVAQLTPAVSR